MEFKAELFAEKAGVREVYLFGSVAEGTARGLDFDIDLALQGGDEIRAVLIAEESDFPVDVSDYDELPEYIRRRIDTHGLALLKRTGAGRK